MQSSVVQKHIVTGGLGFIGKHLVEELLSDLNNFVYILDNGSRVHDQNTRKRIVNHDRVCLLNCDISSTKDADKGIFMGEHFRDAYVWHLAAINGTKNFYERPKDVLDVSINSIMNMVEASRMYAAKRLIVASSSEVYQQPTVVPTLEEEQYKIPDPKNPRYSYAFGKMVSEMYAHHACNELEYVIFRPHNFYGSGGGFDHVIPAVIEKIYESSNSLKNKKCQIKLQGTGLETRSFCHVKDGVKGILKTGVEGKSGEVYHIGTEEEVSIQDLVSLISDAIKINTACDWSSSVPLGATTRRCPDITKAKKVGWLPLISLKSGIEDTISWYIENLRNKKND